MGSTGTVRGKFGAQKSVPMVDAISLLVERITQTPIALLVCYNVLFDAEEEDESLFNSCQLERSGIEVNTKQKLFGFEQNLKLQGDQVISLECNGKSYWFTNRLPSSKETKEMLGTPERVYFLTKKGSHDVPDKVVEWDTVLKANRLVWTESKLRDWQKRFAFHSATAVKKTFEHTTQHYKSLAYENQLFPKHSFVKRFPALKVRRLDENVYTDSLELAVPRPKGGKVKFYGQLFVTGKSKLVKVYALPKRTQVTTLCETFFVDVGVPDPTQGWGGKSPGWKVVFDGAGENTTAFHKLKEKYHVLFHHSEPHKHTTTAERYIQEIKKRCEKTLSVFGGHERMEYLIREYIPDAMNHVAKKSLNWKSPVAKLYGYTPDISNFRFHWWEPIWFLDSHATFFERMRPGFFLSIAHATGDEMCFNIQPAWKPKEDMPHVLQRGVVLPRYPNETYHGAVNRAPSGCIFPVMEDLPPPYRGEAQATLPTQQTVQPPTQGRGERAAAEPTTVDEPTTVGELATARDAIGQGDELSTPSSNTGNSSDEGTSDCVSQASDTTGQEDNEEDTEAEDDSPVGAVDPSYVDDINSELQDQGIGVGKDQFSTDIHILGHTLRKGKLDLRVRLGSSLIPTKVSWEDLRVDTPSTLANYILTHKIGAKSEDPESRKPYEWAKGYVPNARRASVMLEQTYGVYAPNLFKIRRAQLSDTKRKRKRSVSRNRRTSNPMGRVKYGVPVPNSVQDAYTHDQRNGDNLWEKAIREEVQTIIDYGTFKFLEPGEDPPEGYQEARLRTILEVKQDLRRKARCVAGGHMVDAYDINCYSSNMKGVSARLLMLIADANGYDVRVGDVKNAYLCAFTKEKVWTTCGPEFTKVNINGTEVNMMGRKAIIVKALYGLKSSGKAWHAHLADILRGWGFTPSRFDPDVWYRFDESTDMYEYIGTHTDDLLVVGPPGLPDKLITTLRTIFTIKGGGEPEFHLGCDYKKVSLCMDDRMGKQADKLRLTEPPEYDPLVAVVTSDKGSVDPPRDKRDFWFIGTKTYIQEALVRCAKIMKLEPIVRGGKTISPVEQIRKHGTPIVITTGYNPYSDTTEPCGPIEQRAYQQLLGIALWIVLCGRYDIAFAVNTLSAFSAAPRRGHLERAYRLIGYLRKYPEKWIKIDSSRPGGIPGEEYHPFDKIKEMKEEYPDVEEDLDPKAPEPRGKEIYTTCFFDAALGTPETKGRGHTGIILFAGRTPVTCISRRQGTAEGSTYGSEYIAGRQSVEEVMTLRGALRALGVPVRTPTTWYGDNLGMLQSTGLPDSTLKKRHMSIAYHMCREQVAMGAILPIKVGTGNNVADMSTKALDIQPIEHLCKVVFAKPFHTPEDINLRRVKVWFRQIS